MENASLTANVCWTPLAVWRVGKGTKVPAAAWESAFFSMNRVDGSLSVVCEASFVPASEPNVDRGWRGVRFEAIDEMSEAHVRATVSRVLSAAGIKAIDAGSETMLVKETQLHDAMVALERAGFLVEL
ncbi:MAG: hypothetical protein ACJ790_20720 [Myxococcaceae bacterium]